jgi:hypothetical protein
MTNLTVKTMLADTNTAADTTAANATAASPPAGQAGGSAQAV